MSRLALAFALFLALVPAAAQETPPEGDVDEGLSLIERGVRLLFREFLSDMEPALRDLAEGMDRFVTEAEPMLRDLARMMEDVSNYHPPEMLPNGDIIIRRKTLPEAEAEGELEI